ncbi:MAG: septum formation protein Maf [Lachnospiraceae bacterium]|nr:septum formation protein Maf [Lachnospiraceae bacterium]
MSNYNLILASASPRRKELLQQVGAAFEVCPSQGEETITTQDPAQAVMELSRQKAAEVAKRLGNPPAQDSPKPHPCRHGGRDNRGTIVLGADTLVAFAGKILGKPKGQEEAKSMLRMLSGNTHSVFTGVTLCINREGQEDVQSFYEETEVTLYPMTERQIAGYVATGEPMDKAGSYGIQGRFAVHIQGIRGDYNNVVGLPVARIYQELMKSGIEIL